MGEQMKITMDLDEAICVLKGLSKVRENLVTDFRNLGMQEEAMEHFRVECALELAIKAVEKQVPVKPNMVVGSVGRCGVCKNFVAYNVANYCECCGQRLNWEEKENEIN